MFYLQHSFIIVSLISTIVLNYKYIWHLNKSTCLLFNREEQNKEDNVILIFFIFHRILLLFFTMFCRFTQKREMQRKLLHWFYCGVVSWRRRRTVHSQNKCTWSCTAGENWLYLLHRNILFLVCWTNLSWTSTTAITLQQSPIHSGHFSTLNGHHTTTATRCGEVRLYSLIANYTLFLYAEEQSDV